MSKKTGPQFEFRVVAGALKGKLIKAPDLGVTRPPLTRLRKAIFDYLNPYLMYASYLDLFSGTGSYLFEAVSRGAKKAYGVELERKLVEAINAHAKKFAIDESLFCYCEDVLKFIPRMAEQKQKFEIIMIAPPQYKGIIDQTLSSIKENDILTDNGRILCQHDTSETKKTDFSLFEIDQQRKYGNTTFTILKKA